MIQQSVLSDDPIVFLEPKRRYYEKGPVDVDAPLADAYPLHATRLVRAGRDATVLAYGPMVRTALDAATAAEEDGRDLEVFDLRSLSRWTCARSTTRYAGPVGAWWCTRPPATWASARKLAARITEECFYSLEAPVLRVTGYDTPYPAARVEEDYLPTLDRVLDGVDRTFGW